MLKKGKINIFIGIIITLLISYITGFLYSNYNIIKENAKSNNNVEIISTNFKKINSKKYKSTNEISEISLKVNKQYVKKLYFKYKTKSNFSWELKYKEIDHYGNYVEKNIKDISSNKINVFSEKINNRIEDITLIVNNAGLEIYDLKILNNLEYINNIIMIFILIGINIYCIISFRNYLCKHIEYLFIIIAISSGLGMIISNPISMGISWDEQIHFDNIYGLSNNYYSEAALELIHPFETNFAMFNTSEEKLSYISHLNKIDNNVSNKPTDKRFTYNMCSYIPEIALFLMANKLDFNITTIFILGKICNLLTYSIIIFFAIKKMPKGKYLMCSIALFPTCIFLATNYSYDPFVIAFIFLGFAYFYHELLSKDKKINRLNVIISIISFVLGSLSKAIYIPFILLLMLIPKKKFNSKKQKNKFNIGLIVIFILIMSTFVLPTLAGNVNGDERGGNTNVSQQINLIINQPVSFIKVFKENVIDSGLEKIIGTGGLTSYSYKGNITEKNVYYTILFLLIFTINLENTNNIRKFKIKEKTVVLITCLFIICLIYGAMYLSFTPVGSTTINGVQSRYFIPLLLPLLLLFNNNNIKKDLDKKRVYIIISLLFVVLQFYPILFDLI